MMRGPLALGALLCASCFLAGNEPASVAEVPPVGPAPLRRLTNEEYVNALQDLFPGVSVSLPALPADAVLGGFDNAAEAQEPSDVLVARYEQIANLYAAALTADDATLAALAGCSTPDAACANTLITQVGRRVFRRPLSADEVTRFATSFATWQAAVDFRGAADLVLSAMLQSPQFVYRPEPVTTPPPAALVMALDPYALATRLSFLLWQSIPDEALLDAAASGSLLTADGLTAQATRMLADDRARRTFWSFHRQWLGLDLVLTPDQATRTPSIDPAWSPATQASAERETELFVENTFLSGGTLHDLLLDSHAWVDGEMARVYHLPPPADPTTFAPVDLAPATRAGVLTRAAFLAGTSHAGGTSPPIRGNAVELRLFCELPVQPPPNADLSMPTAPPGAGPETTRALFAQRTAPAACQACHAGLNGIGFGFEEYDAAGAWRSTEVGLPIDASGVLFGTDLDGPFDGAIELSGILDRSAMVHRCAVQAWARYALARAPDPVEQPLMDTWTQSFVTSGDVRALLLQIATSPTFRLRSVP